MWIDNKKAISEVNTILKQLEDDSLKKIPQEIIEELEKNATEDTSYIKENIPLKDLLLEEETREILAVICYNYFCTSEEQNEWRNELNENEIRYQNELHKKYNNDNLFKKRDYQDNNEEYEEKNETSLIEYKESFFHKIWNKIISILKIKKLRGK